jgi:hypothetical protein
MKNSHFEKAPRVSATGVATVAILATIMTMVISVSIEPQSAKGVTRTANLAPATQLA